MDTPHLLYFADPMCSWCWGYSPVIAAVERQFAHHLPIRTIMGGLRPYTTEPMTAEARARSRGHWQRVHEASGQPIDLAFFDRDSFTYDTEPACRAVVVLRRHGPAQALAALRAIQRAFYAENTDVTDPEHLTRIAAALGHDPVAFRQDLDSEAARHETAQDFATSQNAGVQGFPTLAAGPAPDNRYTLITHGYQPEPQTIAAITQWQSENAGT